MIADKPSSMHTSEGDHAAKTGGICCDAPIACR